MRTSTMPGHLIRRMQQTAVHLFAARIRKSGHDLTPVQFAALEAIDTNPGMDQAGIAALIAFDKATIGGVVSRLEQKGLVARTVSKHDRRARALELTDAGRETLARLVPLVEQVQDDILANLNPEERARFLALAARLIQRGEG